MVLERVDILVDWIGIIAPYNDQVNEIRRQIPGIDLRGCINTRAKKRLIVVVSGNEQSEKGLIDMASISGFSGEYNKFKRL